MIFAICGLVWSSERVEGELLVQVWVINYKHFFDPVHGSAPRHSDLDSSS